MISLLLAAAVLSGSEIARIEVPGQEAPAPHRPCVEIAAGAPVPVKVFFTAPPASPTFSFYRVAEKWTAPLVEDKEMPPDGDGFRAVLEIPAASIPQRYLLRVKGTGTPADIDVVAYPANLPERLRRLTGALSQSGGAVGVFGPGSTVKALLRAWQVPYVDYDPYGRSVSIAVGDFIGHDLDGQKLPESAAARTLFLTTAPQFDAPGDSVRAEAAGPRKTVFASGEDWSLLPTHPALQYRFLALFSQTLSPSTP